MMNDRPRIVCLCGSTRFGEAFREANLRETLAGKIVLSIGCEWHSDQALGLTYADKERLDALHLRKIDLADEILVLNVGGYVGSSTANEMAYASLQGKDIRFLEQTGLVACEACGVMYHPTFGYHEAGEYSYCAECCSW